MKRTFDENASNFFRYSSVLSNAHYDMAEIYRVRQRSFGLLVVCVTTSTGTAAFTSLAKDPQPGLGNGLIFAIGLLSVLASVLSALQTFLGFNDLQIRHKGAGDGYSAVRRELELLLMKYPGAMGLAGQEATDALDSLKNRLDDLDKTSPTIPDKVYDAASKKTPTDR
jgi:hypothetical protein